MKILIKVRFGWQLVKICVFWDFEQNWRLFEIYSSTTLLIENFLGKFFFVIVLCWCDGFPLSGELFSTHKFICVMYFESIPTSVNMIQFGSNFRFQKSKKSLLILAVIRTAVQPSRRNAECIASDGVCSVLGRIKIVCSYHSQKKRQTHTHTEMVRIAHVMTNKTDWCVSASSVVKIHWNGILISGHFFRIALREAKTRCCEFSTHFLCLHTKILLFLVWRREE